MVRTKEFHFIVDAANIILEQWIVMHRLTLITGKIKNKGQASYLPDFQRYFTLEWSAFDIAYFRQNT